MSERRLTNNSITGSIEDRIDKSKKNVTIMFTDIKGSTEYWDKYGDTAGRLMVDRHNRLLFPLVKKYGGTVIKTIGDSIMASFKKPQKALKSAIAMQQAMNIAREQDPEFNIGIRIGIHTGEGIIENKDVFGDVVNVASRVESQADADQILISQNTYDGLPSEKFRLRRQGFFVPKGKSERVSLFSCDWLAHPSLVGKVHIENLIPLDRGQLMEQLLYMAFNVIAAIFIMYFYLRFFLSDYNFFYKYLMISPILMVLSTVSIFVIGVIGFLLLASYQRQLWPIGFKFMKGLSYFFIILGLLIATGKLLPNNIHEYWNGYFYKSDQTIQQVSYYAVNVRAKPSAKSRVVAKLHYGAAVVQSSAINAKKGWELVTLSQNKQGWIKRYLPPRIGKPRVDLLTKKVFTIAYYELYAVILGFFGFLIGAFTFRIRPV